MCRNGKLWGGALIAFGIGLLIGSWVDNGFLFHCLSFGLIIVGCGVLKT